MHPAAKRFRALFTLTLTGLLLVSLAAPAWSLEFLDTPAARSTLKGIKALGVEVAPLPSDLERLGLTRDQIQVDVELRLRQSGIPVSDAEAAAIPVLGVWLISYRETDSPVLGFCIDVEFIQFVRLYRDMSIAVPTPTWGIIRVGTADARPFQASRTEFRGLVRDLVDQFINAYLEQNPKQ